MESYTNLSGAPAKARKNAAAWEQLWYFTKGLKQGLPIALGYFPSALAYGVMALAAGLSARQTILISVLVFSGAGQFMAVNLLSGGAPPLAIITANLVVNLRYFVMSASFSRRLNVNWLQAAIIGFGVTDETFVMNYLADLEKPALSGSPLGEHGTGNEQAVLPAAKLCAGVNSISYAGWILGTYAGTLFTPMLCTPGFGAGMGIILYAMFIALLIPAAAGSWEYWRSCCCRRRCAGCFPNTCPLAGPWSWQQRWQQPAEVIIWGEGVDGL